MMNKEVTAGLAWIGSTLAVTLGAVATLKLGYIDRDTFLRVIIGFNGLMIVWYANRMPKTFVPNARVREARRVSGWAQVLGGLVYTGLWAFAPIPVAIWGGLGAEAPEPREEIL